MGEHRTKRCLVAMDALFDTRLGTLNILDPQAVIAMDPEAYSVRTRDVFAPWGFDDELYAVAYAKRDKLTLKNAIITGIIPMVQQTIRQYTESINPLRSGPVELELNMYPYRLNEDECALFASLLEHKLGGVVRVIPVYHPWSTLTLGYMAEHYHSVFLYDWVDWASAIEHSFRSEFAPAVTVVVPKLLSGPELVEADLDAYARAALKAAHPTAWMEIVMSTLVGLTFEPVGYFTFLH